MTQFPWLWGLVVHLTVHRAETLAHQALDFPSRAAAVLLLLAAAQSVVTRTSRAVRQAIRAALAGVRSACTALDMRPQQLLDLVERGWVGLLALLRAVLAVVRLDHLQLLLGRELLVHPGSVVADCYCRLAGVVMPLQLKARREAAGVGRMHQLPGMVDLSLVVAAIPGQQVLLAWGLWEAAAVAVALQAFRALQAVVVA